MIGREKEVKELNKLYDKNRAELVAVYGRRRVGKTYLIDETFAGRITFRHAGLSPADEDATGLLRAQLDHFYNSLILFCKKRTMDHGSLYFWMNCPGWTRRGRDLSRPLKASGTTGAAIGKI